MIDISHQIKTFLKAQGAAWVATYADYMMRIFLDKVLAVGYLHATFLGALTGGFVNCAINYKWAFKDNLRKKKSVAWRYLLVWSGSIFFNTAGTWFFKEIVGLKAYYAMVVASFLVAIFWNYLMQLTFVFGKESLLSERAKARNRLIVRVVKSAFHGFRTRE